jgi:long-chain acyl-CoA synthetase
MNSVDEDDICTIIYTSGTSGKPKGVMLTHRNIVSNLLENMKASTLVPGDRSLSFLPLNHIYEKAGMYFFIHCGVGIYFAENMESIAQNLKEIRPHTFNTVPRLLEKVFDKIMQTGSELPAVKRSIFNWSVKVGLKYDPDKSNLLQKRRLKVANKLVFSKWREALGGNIKQIQCGASALQPRLARIFWAAGIKVLEGYGLTETSPVISANRVDAFRFGSVGKVYDNLELKFGEEGEIMVKGPSIMKGYYRQESLTKEVLSDDGWFKTGDVGHMEDGYLFITDRKKELFKTSGGLYIAPQQIENQLKESIHIDQAMVVGDGKKFPAALIVPNFELLIEEMSKDFDDRPVHEMIKDPKVQAIYQKEIDRVNESLGKWEKLKKFRLMDVEWSPETDELTPTLKLKRRIILKKFSHVIEEIYDDDFAKNLDHLESFEDEVEWEKAEKLKEL